MSSTDPQRAALDHALTFAVYVLGSRAAALAALRRAIESASDLERLVDIDTLLRLVRDAIGRAPGARSRPIAEALPAVWNGEQTRELPPELSADPARSAALVGAMRRICFTAVLRSVAETPRCAFVLRHVLGLSDESVGRILQTKPGNLTVLRVRARRPIEQSLGPHCEHFDPGNPCTCGSRLGLAIADGSISTADIAPATDPTPSCSGELERLFRTLPVHPLTDAEAAPLLAQLRAA
ncbi:hypothetical protein OV079_49230 [Nannocystis pusilla]|uniref:RNA polymerase sigma factor 70 region 4 type 2 domain-containing protein n=1 Tax=Nannocystis pusilla TaxID=889268 RepID=A0A9X3F7W5_9BACT|nr:hypothetical protein [Nannocystis pusilla]MCY1013383.1 hypothetical protein [Nannocystis pusilla]